MSHIKEKDKITSRDLNMTELSNMPLRESKVMIIKIFNGHERPQGLSETLKKDTKNVKKKSAEFNK